MYIKFIHWIYYAIHCFDRIDRSIAMHIFDRSWFANKYQTLFTSPQVTQHKHVVGLLQDGGKSLMFTAKPTVTLN